MTDKPNNTKPSNTEPNNIKPDNDYLKHHRDPNKSAVGLKYDGSAAPKVIAKGHGDLADEIIKCAKEHGVLVHEDEQLTRLLAQLELGDDIPKQLYVIIAELIAFSYVLQGKFPENWNNIHNRVDYEV